MWVFKFYKKKRIKTFQNIGPNLNHETITQPCKKLTEQYGRHYWRLFEESRGPSQLYLLAESENFIEGRKIVLEMIRHRNLVCISIVGHQVNNRRLNESTHSPKTNQRAPKPDKKTRNFHGGGLAHHFQVDTMSDLLAICAD